MGKEFLCVHFYDFQNQKHNEKNRKKDTEVFVIYDSSTQKFYLYGHRTTDFQYTYSADRILSAAHFINFVIGGITSETDDSKGDWSVGVRSVYLTDYLIENLDFDSLENVFYEQPEISGYNQLYAENTCEVVFDALRMIRNA